jgi:hypothetical protein
MKADQAKADLAANHANEHESKNKIGVAFLSATISANLRRKILSIKLQVNMRRDLKTKAANPAKQTKKASCSFAQIRG